MADRVNRRYLLTHEVFIIVMWLAQLSNGLKRGLAVMKTEGKSVVTGNKFSAYGYYFPTEWSEETIYSHLDPSRKNI